MSQATSSDCCLAIPRLLAGGPESLRIAPRHAMAVAAAAGACTGLTKLAGWWLTGAAPGPLAALLVEMALALAAALAVAGLAARWLGARVGMLAGVVLGGFLYPLWGCPALDQRMAQLAVLAAMSAFALANVPGRLPPLRSRRLPLAFFGCAAGGLWLAGPVAPLTIGAACVLYLLISSDGRGGRFMVDPLGLLVLGCCATIWVAGRAGWLDPVVPPDVLAPLIAQTRPHTSWARLVQSVGYLGWATLPFSPLIVVAVLIGLRDGHHATLFWRLVACWTAAPPALAVVLPGEPSGVLSWALPPLAIVGGAGLRGCAVRLRRRRFRSPQSAGGKPAVFAAHFPCPASCALGPERHSIADSATASGSKGSGKG